MILYHICTYLDEIIIFLKKSEKTLVFLARTIWSESAKWHQAKYSFDSLMAMLI